MAKRGFSGAMASAFGMRDHDAIVVDVVELAPNFQRVRMQSPTVFADAELGPTAWLRFWFPDPENPEFEHQRAYTITEADPDSGIFAVDFVLHEPSGPASAWAAKVEPGMSIEVASFGSSLFTVPEELPAGYLLIGDSASIPAINSILDTVPADVPIEVYFEEHDDSDRLIPLAAHPRLSIHWIPRRGETSLAAALEVRDWSNWTVWMAPESGSLKYLRKRLKEEFGFPKSEITARAYWYSGRAFGSRRGKADQVPTSADSVPTSADPTPANAEATPTPAPTSASESSPPTPKGSWRTNAGGRLIAPLKSTLWIAGILQGIVTLVELAPYVLLVELSRQLLSGADAAQLWATGVWALVLMGAGVLLSLALMFWLHLVDARFGKQLRQRLLAKLAKLPLGWFVDRGSGRIKQLVQDDTLALHYLVTHSVSDAVQATLAPIAVLVYLFIVDWRIALVLLVPVLVYIVTMYIMLIQSGTKPKQNLQWKETLNVEATTYLAGQPVVRIFGGAADSRFRARLDEYIRFLSDWQRPFTSFKTVMDLVNRPSTFLLLIVSLGTLLIVTNAMDPVNLLPFLFLGTSFGSRLLGIGYGLSGLSTGLLAARRIQNVLDEEELTVHENPESRTSAVDLTPASANSAVPTSTDDPTAPTTPRGQVEFDSVGFAYRPGVPVIEDVSVTLRPGTVTALVGPSGSGKSTLAALLARFHDVSSGAIKIGGRDVREMSPDELYAQVGFVFQDTALVHASVRDNIALAVPDASLDQVMTATREAQIHHRIESLPQGYDTVLGPDPALSGGEVQRLSIARAILADTPVLVLDEATAFADPESEHLVQQALSRLSQGRTVLIIAHRLHTITEVDSIVVLDGGQVAETGTHTQLLNAGGRYQALWDARTTEGASR